MTNEKTLLIQAISNASVTESSEKLVDFMADCNIKSLREATVEQLKAYARRHGIKWKKI